MQKIPFALKNTLRTHLDSLIGAILMSAPRDTFCNSFSAFIALTGIFASRDNFNSYPAEFKGQLGIYLFIYFLKKVLTVLFQ